MNIRLNQMKFDVPSYEKTPALKFRISKMQKLGGDYSYFHKGSPVCKCKRIYYSVPFKIPLMIC